MTRDLAPRVESYVGAAVSVREVLVVEEKVTLVSAHLPPLAARASALRALLEPDERARAGGMHVAAASHGYVAGRALLRAALGAALGADPASLALVSGAHGKPHLAGAAAPLGFNVAHSGGLAVVALSSSPHVGVDVESERALPHLDRLVERGLTPGERALYRGWCEEGIARESAFLRAWTVKEARIKALGLSIGAALSRDRDDVAALPWTFAELDDPRYVCAVAVAPRS